MIKLCYKEYDFKVTLGACKSFYDQTGRDLQCVLLDYLHEHGTQSGISIKDGVMLDTLGYMRALHSVCGFEDASKLITCLIKSENNSIPLNEIQDAMFRVSWLPTDSEGDFQEPWPLVMLSIAVQVNDYFSKALSVKKMVTSVE